MKIKTTKALTIFTALLLMIVSLPGKTVNAATNTTYYWPVSNTKVNSPYGNRKAPVEGASSFHKGCDIAMAKNSPIYAPAAGTVETVKLNCTHNYGKKKSCGCNGGSGNYICIKHPDGRRTYYKHITTAYVKVGQKVKMGDKIASVGSTGCSSGNHLHLEVTKTDGSTRENPVNVFSKITAETALSKITSAPNLSYSGLTFYGSGIVTASWSRPSGSLGSIVSYTFSYKRPTDKCYCISGATRSTKSMAIAVVKGTILKVQATISYEGNTYTTAVKQITIK